MRRAARESPRRNAFIAFESRFAARPQSRPTRARSALVNSCASAFACSFEGFAHRRIRPRMEKPPRNRYALFLSPAIFGCAIDLATKAWMFSWPELRTGGIYWIWRSHVGVQLSWNDGALFGIGQGNVWLFAALSVAAAIAIPLWLFVFAAAR